MKILGIDYGRNKMGLAIAEGPLARPLKVFRYKDSTIVAEQIQRIIKDEGVEKVVIGVSEGEMGKESKNFSTNFAKMLNVPVETFDETLSTQDAQRMSKEAGIKQKRRHLMEDAYAAAIMLQNFLDY